MNEVVVTTLIGIELGLVGLILAFHGTLLNRYLDIIEKDQPREHLVASYRNLLITNIVAIGTMLAAAASMVGWFFGRTPSSAVLVLVALSAILLVVIIWKVIQHVRT